MLNILIWKHIIASRVPSQAKVIKLVVVSVKDQRGVNEMNWKHSGTRRQTHKEHSLRPVVVCRSIFF